MTPASAAAAGRLTPMTTPARHAVLPRRAASRPSRPRHGPGHVRAGRSRANLAVGVEAERRANSRQGLHDRGPGPRRGDGPRLCRSAARRSCRGAHGSGGYRCCAKQRSTSAESAGLTLMGVRLYNARRGLFTSVDPVAGGNSTAYTYPQDPINSYDLDGRLCWSCAWNSVKSAASSAWNGAKSAGRWAWRNRNTIIQYAGYAAAGACIVATAGVCSVAAGVVAGASVLNRAGTFVRRGQWRSGSAWTRLLVGSAFDIASAAVPGARFANGTYLARHAMRGRHVLRTGYVALRQTFRHGRSWASAVGIGLGAAWTRWGWSQ